MLDISQINLALITSRADLIDVFTRLAKQDKLNYRVAIAGVDEAGGVAKN